MNKKTIIVELLALVVLMGQEQETEGRVIEKQSKQMAFSQQVMLADSITKNPVSYTIVYDADGKGH